MKAQHQCPEPTQADYACRDAVGRARDGERDFHLDGAEYIAIHRVRSTERLRKMLAPLAEVARIADLYLGPPCNNPEPLADSFSVLLFEHGDEQVEITMGDCRKVRMLLSS